MLTPPLTEDPTLYRTSREWVLLVDSFAGGRYLAYGSEDLRSWTDGLPHRATAGHAPWVGAVAGIAFGGDIF